MSIVPNPSDYDPQTDNKIVRFPGVREDEAVYDATPRRPSGFAMIPREVLDLKDGNLIGMFAVLSGFANEKRECWPSIKKLCESSGWSDRHVRNLIQRLADAKVLVVERRFTSGMRSSHMYRLLADIQIGTTFQTIGTTDRSDRYTVPVGSVPGTNKLEPVELDPLEQELTPPTPKKRVSPTKSSLEGFDAWYSAYPKHEARGDAERAWSKLTPDQRALAQMGLTVQVNWPKMRGDPKYIPFPSTWLNGHRWEDEPQPGHQNGNVSAQNGKSRNPHQWGSHAAEDWERLSIGMTAAWGSARGGIDTL